MSKRLVLAGFLAAVVSVGVVLLLVLPRGEPPRGLRSAGSETARFEDVPDGTEESGGPTSAANAGSTVRVDLDRSPTPFRLRVLDADGQPIQGVEISWSALAPIDLAWPWIASAARCEHGGRALSGADGLWSRLPDAPDTAHGSVVWVTSEAHAARHFVLAAGESIRSLPNPIHLDPAPGLDVIVVDADGAPIADAEVHQRLELALEARVGVDDPALAANAALWRCGSTDPGGRLRLSSLPGPQAVHAARQDRISPLWRGSSPSQVRLVLTDTVLCLGRVTPETPSLDVAGALVRASARIGGVSVRLGATTVQADGSLRPMRIARAEAEHYDFELSGGRVVPTTHRVPTPAPREVLQLDLLARSGTLFPVRVVDSAGQPLAGAVVGWAWAAGSIWEWWRGSTDPSGLCEATCIPPGRLWLEVTKAGYLRHRQELEHAGDFSPAYQVALERGGIVRGRVTASGRPIEEFRIVVMPATEAGHGSLREHAVRDARGGLYELDGVPLGDLALFAFAQDHARTSTITARVTAETPASVDFDLPSPAQIQGVVRDVHSYQPVEGAAVQSWIDADVARLRPWGPVALTDSQGRFSFHGAPPAAECVVEVRAAGYAPTHARSEPRNGAVVDLGTLLLSPPTTLEVFVTGDERLPPEEIHGRLVGSERLARRSAGHNGRIVFEDLVVEDQTLTLDAGTDWGVDFRLFLTSAHHQTFRTSFRRVRDLAVQVRAAPGDVLPPGCVLRAVYVCRTAGRQASWASFVPESGPIDIGYLDAERIALDVVDGKGSSLGSALILEPDQRDPLFILTVGGPDRGLRIVDRAGDPLPRATVSVARAPGALERAQLSDPDGRVILQHFDVDRADVLVYATNVGTVLHRDLLLHAGSTEVRVDPRARARLLLRDGDLPVGGVIVTMFDGHGRGYFIERQSSSAAGEVTGHPVAADSYEIVLEHPGIWPMRKRIDVTDDQRVLPIPVRRLGGVDLTVRAGGLPLTGCTVHLESEEFGTSVDAWVAESRCARTPTDGRTDASGRLEIDGLPRGGYRWRIDREDGEVATGRFVVEPALRISVDLGLP